MRERKLVMHRRRSPRKNPTSIGRGDRVEPWDARPSSSLGLTAASSSLRGCPVPLLQCAALVMRLVVREAVGAAGGSDGDRGSSLSSGRDAHDRAPACCATPPHDASIHATAVSVRSCSPGDAALYSCTPKKSRKSPLERCRKPVPSRKGRPCASDEEGQSFELSAGASF